MLRGGRLDAVEEGCVAVLTLGAIACGDNDRAAEAGSAGPVSVVTSALEAHNRGDLDQWYGHWDDAEPSLITDSFVNANRNIEVVEPCQASGDATEGGTIVVCMVDVSDDFYEPAGISGTTSTTFQLNSDGKIIDWSTDDDPITEQTNQINKAFWPWLRSNHPEVFDEIGPVGSSVFWMFPGTATENPEHMLTALDYIDAFIVASETHPLS